MRGSWTVPVGLLLAVGLVGAAGAEDTAPAVDGSASGGPPASALLLSIRARALGVEMAPLPQPSDSLGLERVTAPTGAGTSRMPSARTEIARGVYMTVMPACLPGVDELGLPMRRPTAPVRR
jgi:hypothetical protein